MTYALLPNLLKLVSLRATGPEVYVFTMTTVLSGSYDYLEETLNYLKCLKLNNHTGDNFTELCAAILVDAEQLESTGDFNPEHLGYIAHIF